ncbi:MAG: hypothetical protein WCK09_02465 [Bacteroidota bacterium]
MKHPTTWPIIPSGRNSLPALFNGMVTQTTLPCGSVIELAEIDMPSITKGTLVGDFAQARFKAKKHGNRKIILIKKTLCKAGRWIIEEISPNMTQDTKIVTRFFSYLCTIFELEGLYEAFA